MMIRYKNILIGLMLSTVMILGACSDGNASADIGSYPEGVQSGEVSTKYYDEVNRYLEDAATFKDEINAFYSESTLEEKESQTFHVEYNKRVTEFLEKAGKIKFKPKTKAEKENYPLLKAVVETDKTYIIKLKSMSLNEESEGNLTLREAGNQSGDAYLSFLLQWEEVVNPL